jgi:hypothetical protein
MPKKIICFISILFSFTLFLTGCTSFETVQPAPTFSVGEKCDGLGDEFVLADQKGLLECRFDRDGNLVYVKLSGDTTSPYLESGLADINLCKLEDQRPLDGFGGKFGGQNTAFPLTNTLIPPSGEFNIGVVPIDFSDSPAQQGVNDLMDKHLEKVDEWLSFTTNGKTTYSWHMPKEWLRMPLESNQYKYAKQNIAEDGSYLTVSDQLQSTEAMTSQIFSAAEPFINLAEMDYIWVILPPSTKNVDWSVNGNLVPVTTSTGTYPLTYYSMGNVLWNQHSRQVPIYAILLHELLHAHGASQHAPGNEYALHLGNSIGTVMGAWDSFILGWRDETDFACIDGSSLESLDLTLTPLDLNSDGYKAGLIKISENEIIVIESRRQGPFSHNWLKGTAFVSAYLVDTSKPSLRFDGDNEKVKDYFSYYLEINEPHQKKLDFGQPLVNMMGPQYEYFSVRHVGLTGDVFNYAGISIEVINQSDTDTVRISKID